ncbi:MAG: tautomerase family protein [Candidatus Carbobacillus altaicus]|uniref:4-oxalocrotonate tautomerase-like domain-containing protein n=1 Tax=Candidatus Carbonibacillus altaicus TaxID=2163959 RepID=A0A2R6Y0G5_9BACL|nr:tautomerase family protein [Candidatus Carbobacillus altaicus]PTQ56179.1 MAG: hypothetical protein BSOLF_0606 [Candidatus Carbobacillus altaicus]
MPFFNMKVAHEDAAVEQKPEMIRRVTDIMVEILGKGPNPMMAHFEKIDPENVGMGEWTMADIRTEKMIEDDR